MCVRLYLYICALFACLFLYLPPKLLTADNTKAYHYLHMTSEIYTSTHKHKHTVHLLLYCNTRGDYSTRIYVHYIFFRCCFPLKGLLRISTLKSQKFCNTAWVMEAHLTYTIYTCVGMVYISSCCAVVLDLRKKKKGFWIDTNLPFFCRARVFFSSICRFGWAPRDVFLLINCVHNTYTDIRTSANYKLCARFVIQVQTIRHQPIT